MNSIMDDPDVKRLVEETDPGEVMQAFLDTRPDVVDMMADVEAFHQKFGIAYEGKPRMLPDDLFDFRTKFHREESEEYEDEQHVLRDIARRPDPELRADHIVTALETQLDSLVDAVFVFLGTAQLQFGRRVFNEAWRRVVAANMAKVRAGEVDGCVDSGRNPMFDIVKPPGWTAPDHKDLVADHEPLIGE